MAALTLALDLCFNKSASGAEDQVRRAELKEACLMLQESKTEMPAADRFLTPLMELLRKHKIQLQDAGMHNQYLTPPESTTTPSVQTTGTGSSCSSQSIAAQAQNVLGHNASLAANPDLDFDGLWQEFINMVPDSSAPGWDDLLADFDQASLFIDFAVVHRRSQNTMSMIQALPAHANVSDKWPNHVWSPKAAVGAIHKSTTLVKLTSSKDEVAVHIEKELLCFYSLYYVAALNGRFLEAKKDSFEVGLTGEQLRGFESWIYTGGFHMGILSESEESL
ncbi:hypothetical protein KCU64_g1033, partial [Aureobasidium melanogenum]